MNPVYAGLVFVLTFVLLIWFVLSGQEASLTVTFVIVTLGLGLGAAYIMSREQAQEEAYAEGEEGFAKEEAGITSEAGDEEAEQAAQPDSETASLATTEPAGDRDANQPPTD